ncbi:vacuolar protein sorting protein 62 [Nannizzia gypsea CBS 118893]|uniref:Vacuolar protein sorting protein 62 n=1 Tax=Arthroderma gypseum (strain ATCC MYA-4604 / CBS 118893) TaxID=535722 RepID=E4UW50_ARTGP|nr:vacuolar protein sorting protein 62 [Nannizzia gypsea CBS 118893]EFR02498.1 vacuolar protein sorting protein 62 [Nannizzia gypsea CBS 118893]
MGKCGSSHCAWPALAALILGLGIGNISAASVYIAAEQCLAPAPAAAVPDYVIKYDPYQPSDIGAQLKNAVPMINHVAIPNAPTDITLDNLDQLNKLGGDKVCLTSKEGIQALPAWFRGVKPNKDGKTEGAVSSVIVVREHGDEGKTVDAFYFYFYAYNQGNTVLGIEFGDHVGDWEHNMIRFRNGKPEAVWYSQHAAGQAFQYSATDKRGGRWGDEQLPDNTPGQVELFGQRKYTTGPNGPMFKELVRDKICPSGVKLCLVLPWVTAVNEEERKQVLADLVKEELERESKKHPNPLK